MLVVLINEWRDSLAVDRNIAVAKKKHSQESRFKIKTSLFLEKRSVRASSASFHTTGFLEIKYSIFAEH